MIQLGPKAKDKYFYKRGETQTERGGHVAMAETGVMLRNGGSPQKLEEARRMPLFRESAVLQTHWF